MDFQISMLPAGAKALLQDNPYFVLGVSSLATESEASGVVKKIQRFAQLKVASSYKTEFNLGEIENPERSQSTIQVAFDRIANNSYRWLWFSKAEVEYGEKSYKLSDNWKDIKETELKDSDEYDIFLLHFLYLLVEDASFSDSNGWIRIFSYIKNTLQGNNEKIKELLDFGADLNGLSNEMIRICSSAINALSIEEMCNVYNLLDSTDSYNTVTEALLNHITNGITRWAEESIVDVKKVNDGIQAIYSGRYVEIPVEDAKELLRVLSEYDAHNWNTYEYIENHIANDIIKDSVRNTVLAYINYCRVKLQDAANFSFEKEAAYFYSKLFCYYFLLFPEYKDNWTQGFGIEYLDTPLEYFSVDELCQKAEYYFDNNRVEDAKSVFDELIRRNEFIGYRKLFDYYEKISDIKQMADVMKKAYLLYNSLESSQKENYYNSMVYMFLSLDIYGDSEGIDIFQKEIDRAFSAYGSYLTDKDEQLNVGKKILSSNCKKDYVVGWYWLMKAYKGKNIQSCYHIAKCYYNGIGVEKDYKKAVFYLSKGCNSDPDCAYLLGKLTYEGQGVPKDEEKGIKYIKYAADLGVKSAIKWLDENATNSFTLHGYSSYDLLGNPIVLKNSQCSVYFKDIRINDMEEVEIVLWATNRNTVPVILESQIFCGDGNNVGESRKTDIQSKELHSIKTCFPKAFLTGTDKDYFELKLSVKDKDMFGGYVPVLFEGVSIKFNINNKEQMIEYRTGDIKEYVPRVQNSTALRNRGRNALEVSLPCKAEADIENILKTAGYKKNLLRNTWVYTIKNDGTESGAEEAAKLITGNNIMG
ncbi:tetratricopeptide repeat protein [Butyrivibrio sp. YAB3001]|uniref:tetratricopeptide repeat protein n=1 Tax=Butyrivibrio sp. YAB3001 TaxID=1520812 RepID=UPI0008F65C28|nr:tetratricopeptide repeat protein [Butyrivibrio sp. YAB3001]SFB81702.1 TPR repeat [Butyrivibrio sp. YAB3001]